MRQQAQIFLQQHPTNSMDRFMKDIDKIEALLMTALSDYSEKNKLVISQIEQGCLSSQFDKGNGLTLTLNNGKVFDISITEV